MRLVSSICVLLLTVSSMLCFVTDEKQAPANIAAVDEIKGLEAQRSRAQVQGDVGKLDQLLAPEFVEINTAANVRSKEQNLQGHKTGQTHWQKFDLDDLAVHVDGDTAVVTGRLTRKGTFAGRDLSGQSRYTRYYLKRNGKWQAIFQYSIPERKPFSPRRHRGH